jgi:hypothetical protein
VNSSIRIIKPQANDGSENSRPDKDMKTARQQTREIADTIKGWIAERQQRRRTEERIDFRLWQAEAANQGP